MVIQADGKIVIAGNFNTFNNSPVGYMARLLPDGSLDNSFVGSADDRVFNFGAVNGGAPNWWPSALFAIATAVPAPSGYLDSNGNLLISIPAGAARCMVAPLFMG